MRIILNLAAFCLFVSLSVIARTEVLYLPENLTEIEGYAFAGNTSITEVVLGENVTVVDESAFSGCKALTRVVVKNRGSAQIGKNAFPENIEFYAAGDSIVSYNAQGGWFKGFQALLIGQTYPEYDWYGNREDTLPGCDEDAKTLYKLITALKLTAYEPVILRENITIEETVAEVKHLAKSATEQSTTLFFFSGHGSLGGMLVFQDDEGETEYYAPDELRALLDEIPGQKIILIDACYSGGMIGRGENESAQQFAESFVSAFAGGVSSRYPNAFENDGGEYAVLVACRESELSNTVRYEINDIDDEGEGDVRGKFFGLFTGALECAMGEIGRMEDWYKDYPDTLVEPYSDVIPGDKNGDSLLTLSEAYDYVEKAVRLFSEEWNKGVEESYNIIDQTVQVWPDNSNVVLFGR